MTFIYSTVYKVIVWILICWRGLWALCLSDPRSKQVDLHHFS